MAAGKWKAAELFIFALLMIIPARVLPALALGIVPLNRVVSFLLPLPLRGLHI